MSNYPASLDDQSTLYNPADAFSTKPLQSTLAVLCVSTDLTLQLAAAPASLGAPAAYGIVSIEDEEILYAGVSGNNLTGCVRGFGPPGNPTIAIGHAANTAVRWRPVAAYFYVLQQAILAVQTALGVTGAFNFGSAPLVLDVALTAGTTNITAAVPSQAGLVLTVFLAQDATGGRQITWGAMFQDAPVDLDPTASTLSIFRFVSRANGKWYLASPVITGVTS